MIIYRDNYTLETDIIGFDLEVSGGWTPDCQGKQDYDPCFVRGSSRVYRGGDYGCSIYIGETEIVGTGIKRAESVEAAKRACEAWMEEHAVKIRTAVEAALSAELPLTPDASPAPTQATEAP